jgi:signal transduction histidine kinase/DNA-binding NarL/FixJ family response regulator/HPt (histidine-containing phosphotransfer) domain-containing protein
MGCPAIACSGGGAGVKGRLLKDNLSSGRTPTLWQRLLGAFRSHSLLLLFLFAGATVVLATIYSQIVIGFFVQASEENLRDKLRVSALRLASITSAEELGEYHDPKDMNKKGYAVLRKKLMDFAADSNLYYAYYLRIVGDKMQYIADNEDDDSETRSGLDTDMEMLTDNPDLLVAAEKRDVSVTPLGQYVPNWPGLISAYAPVFDKKHEIVAYAGVDINDEEMVFSHKRQEKFLRLMMASVLIVIGSGVFGFYKFRREAELAERASGAKSRFLSRMSHEIRTPMNAVIGMSDLAAMEYGTPQGLDYIAQIKQAGNNLLSIINDILDLSAVESGKLSLRHASYEVASLLSDAITIIRIKLKDKKDIDFFIDIDPELPSKLIGDESRVREILLNLLTNAVKYTFKGFVKLKVSGNRESRTGIILTFEVYDSGIGIKPNDQKRLFLDFSRADNMYMSKIEGTGLGLSITRMLCRAMGGDVKLESKYGAGSKFTASIKQSFKAECLPIGVYEDKGITTIELFETSFIAPDFHVLIVDDLPTNIKVAEGLLAPYHMKIDTCLNGKKSIEMVQRHQYDLVLMDHMMPEMDGFEAVAAIRSLPGKYFQSLPIIAVTANVVSGMKEMFLSNGFDDFLAKPIETSKLAAIVEKWVSIEKRVYADKHSLTTGQMSLGSVLERRAASDRRTQPERRLSAPSSETVSGLLGNALHGIEGLDPVHGIAATGGTLAAYKDVLKLFCMDASERNKSFSRGGSENELTMFITNVHALKSALASIGAPALSADARGLEDAALRKDIGYIREKLGGFSAKLGTMADRITEALNVSEPPLQNDTGRVPESATDAAIFSVFRELKNALSAEDVGKVDMILDRLSSLPLCGEEIKVIERVSILVLSSDFKEASDLVGGILANAGHGGT